MNKCEYCGKETTNKRFCSRECMYASKRKPRNKCPNCGKEVPRVEMKFCSMKCRDEYKKKINEKNRQYNRCIICGKKTLNEKYCSMECLGKDRKNMTYYLDNLPNNNIWTKEKLDYLKNNYGYLPLEAIANYFDVSTSAIIATAKRYNIKSARKWNDKELKIVNDNINDIDFLLKTLKKSPSAIANQIKRLALKDTKYDYNTSPEEICKDILNELGLEYKREVPVNSFRLDFLVNNLDLEVQGTYYHCDPRFYLNGATNKTQNYMISKDKHRTDYLKSQGYDVLYVWEHDLYVNRNYIKELIGKAVLKSRN